MWYFVHYIVCALFCISISFSSFVCIIKYMSHISCILCTNYMSHSSYSISYCVYIPHSSYGISCYVYIPHSSYGISCYVYIPYYTHNIPHFSHKKQHKKPGTQMSTRSIHLLLRVLCKLRFTEGAEQSNLLQCLCNAEKYNWIYRPHNKILKCTHWKDCHKRLSIQHLQTQSIENDIADEHYYKLRSKHSPYGKLFLVKEAAI